MQLISNAFRPGGEIPIAYTQDGVDISPPLSWSEVPLGTQSFALVVDDPDAPDPKAPRAQPWVHWVVVDLPSDQHTLSEGVALPIEHLGLNDWQHAAWDGPAPPIGKHRYRFTLYALDSTLGLERPTKPQLETAMKHHVLDKAVLIGTYAKRALA